MGMIIVFADVLNDYCVCRCTHCDFASTRFDKLKEHLHKQHNVGSAPEKRLRISDMVGKKSPSNNETIEANDAAVQEANPELEVLCDGDYHMVEFELSDGLAMIDGTQEMSYYCFQSISEQAWKWCSNIFCAIKKMFVESVLLSFILIFHIFYLIPN